LSHKYREVKFVMYLSGSMSKLVNPKSLRSSRVNSVLYVSPLMVIDDTDGVGDGDGVGLGDGVGVGVGVGLDDGVGDGVGVGVGDVDGGGVDVCVGGGVDAGAPPVLTVSTIVAPITCDVPADGSCDITFPAATELLFALLTVTLNPKLVSVLRAAVSVCPTTFGTSTNSSPLLTVMVTLSPRFTGVFAAML